MTNQTASELQIENQQLHARIRDLEDKLRWLLTHATLARGLAGESLISSTIDGKLTLHTAAFDILGRRGEHIEVKSAKLTNAGAGSATKYARWMWQKIFGETNKKNFDYLLLIGEANAEWRHHYRDTKSPFVLFCLPFSDIQQFVTAGTRGAVGIQLNSNPISARGKAADLYLRYQMTSAELEQRFGVGLQ